LRETLEPPHPANRDFNSEGDVGLGVSRIEPEKLSLYSPPFVPAPKGLRVNLLNEWGGSGSNLIYSLTYRKPLNALRLTVLESPRQIPIHQPKK